MLNDSDGGSSGSPASIRMPEISGSGKGKKPKSQGSGTSTTPSKPASSSTTPPPPPPASGSSSSTKPKTPKSNEDTNKLIVDLVKSMVDNGNDQRLKDGVNQLAVMFELTTKFSRLKELMDEKKAAQAQASGNSGTGN